MFKLVLYLMFALYPFMVWGLYKLIRAFDRVRQTKTQNVEVKS